MATAMNVSIEEDLKCSVCLSVFDRPKALQPCLHTFCHGCIDDHMAKTKVNGRFRCPNCNEDMKVPKGGAEELRDNFYLSSLVEKLNPTESIPHDTTYCTVHPSAKISLFCDDCKTPICTDCISYHERHKFLKPQQAVKQVEQHVSKFVETAHKLVDGMKTFTVTVNRMQSECDKEERGVLSEISKYFENIRKIVNEEENKLKQHVKESCEVARKDFNDRLRDAENIIQCANDALNSADQFSSTESVIEKLRKYKEITYSLSNKTKMYNETIKVSKLSFVTEFEKSHFFQQYRGCRNSDRKNRVVFVRFSNPTIRNIEDRYDIGILGQSSPGNEVTFGWHSWTKGLSN